MVGKLINNNTALRWAVAALFTILLGLGGWNLAKVASVPEIYATTKYVNKQNESISKQVCDLKIDVNNKIDKMSTGIHSRINTVEIRMRANQEKTEKKLNKIEDKFGKRLDTIQNLIIEHMINKNNSKNNE